MKGCVIGKIDVTTYANIFTSESKEKKHLSSHQK